VRLVFCGTPAFAVPTLKAVLAAGHRVELVLTQPDRPSGRGMQLLPPPVKVAALETGIAVIQPEKIKNNLELRSRLEEIAPDAILVVAYGRIIPRWMLDLPRYGNLNLHGSLLPKYRGAAPVQWALARGERVTGVTTMRLDEGLDTGDMLLQEKLAVGEEQTAEDVFPLLAELGAGLMVRTLAGLEDGSVTPRKQDDQAATLAPLLTREDGRIDFRRSAREIHNRWRGFQPWPGAWTMLRGQKLTLHRLRIADGLAGDAVRNVDAVPGEVRAEAGRFVIACGEGSLGERGWIEALEVQLEGKRRMAAADFLRGFQMSPGEVLT
jgi:methionyl-tRNA formyltransferase